VGFALNFLNDWNVLNHDFVLVVIVGRVRSLADHDHPVVVEDNHFAAVSFLQNGGIKNFRRTPLRDYPAVEASHPRQMGRHPVEIVGGNDDGDSLMINLVKKVNHVVPRANIESSRGLIEQDQLRIAQQSTPKKNRLLLAAGKFTDMPVTKSDEIQARQDRLKLAPLLVANAAKPGVPGKKPHANDFLDGDRKIPIDGFQLGHVADTVQRGTPRRLASQQNLTLLRRDRAEDGAQQCGFASAVWPDDSHELAGPDLKRNVLEPDGSSVADAYIGQFHERYTREAGNGRLFDSVRVETAVAVAGRMVLSVHETMDGLASSPVVGVSAGHRRGINFSQRLGGAP
jgi:hypothetical protein